MQTTSETRDAATAPTAEPGGLFMAFKYKGHRIVYRTPNDLTTGRVRTILTKEPDTIQWLESMPLKSVFLDVGANVGMYSMFAAVMRQAEVYAFEPESQNYALLNANIEANNMSGQVLAFPLALSDQSRMDRLYLQGFVAGGSCNSFGEEVGFDLQQRSSGFVQGAYSVSIDQLVDAGSLPLPDFIKLDVDGFEHKVLRGAAKTLANPKVKEILVELNTHLEEHRSVIEWLRSLGFDYDERQAKGALRKAGPFEGVGEFIFRRGTRLKSSNTLSKKFMIETAPTARGRRILEHVLGRVATAPIVEDPFPYAVIDRIFPDDYYAEMLAHFPTPASLRPIGETGRVGRDDYRERNVVLFNDEDFGRMSARQQTFWREFAGWMYSDLFLNLFVLKFQRALESRLSKILADSPVLRVRGDALLVNDQTNYAIGPHTDAPHRLVTFLFYLPNDDSMRELGTSIYRPKDANFVCRDGLHHPHERFERISTVDFLPNRLLTFPKTERSFHGVEQILRENVNRPLLINNIRLLNAVTH
jgi:FkbM family methyltransferase